MVEFALIFPILILVLVAIFDLGRLVFAYNDITNAARNGARVAVVDQGASNAEGRVISSATALGLTPADVDVVYLRSDLAASCAPMALGCVAEVTARFSWQAITPIIGSIIGPITVTTVSRMPVERIFP